MLSDLGRLVLEQALGMLEDALEARPVHSKDLIRKGIKEVREFYRGARFRVILESTGDHKIQVIKAIRANTGLGLREAKDLTDVADRRKTTVCKGLLVDAAVKFVNEIRGAGGDAYWSEEE